MNIYQYLKICYVYIVIVHLDFEGHAWLQNMYFHPKWKSLKNNYNSIRRTQIIKKHLRRSHARKTIYPNVLTSSEFYILYIMGEWGGVAKYIYYMGGGERGGVAILKNMITNNILTYCYIIMLRKTGLIICSSHFFLSSWVLIHQK